MLFLMEHRNVKDRMHSLNAWEESLFFDYDKEFIAVAQGPDCGGARGS
jgi:hypothetical protein